nr:MAG TPA: hypothetical protein [Caudoviricetes sp.]
MSVTSCGRGRLFALGGRQTSLTGSQRLRLPSFKWLSMTVSRLTRCFSTKQ